ncbi:sensor histidine kinase [Pacificibacter marinus]|uniref:sensor histidine kinase n=1 Tax=Pacificibacter marinus TaxID=658057 RepID=UPI001C07354A|nr:sensor histidine kinase [Pacificibacter marinus]MBU2867791.1 sensor histidine kinase [Pacificibacter marinus]
MSSGRRSGVIHRLWFRIAALLSLALFPIGLISVSLTHQFAQATEKRAEAALLALTSQAAQREDSLIRTGVGSSNALAAVVGSVLETPDTCNTIFVNFVANNSDFSFAGFVGADGILKCGSTMDGFDFTDNEVYKAMVDDPAIRSDLVRFAPISKTTVIVLSTPVFIDAIFQGYVAVSLPHREMSFGKENAPQDRPVTLVTFNSDGDVLSAESGLRNVEMDLPAGAPLVDLALKHRVAFSGKTKGGEDRVFAVVPILTNQIYAIGSWSRTNLSVAPGLAMATPMIFPIVMWLTSLGVAYFAVHRLVIKHIRRLGRDMRRFTQTRRHNDSLVDENAPYELREIDYAWRDLAEKIVRDEAELEGTIHDKTVLLKEVHHRVKNNLQLIASIVSMKMRKARSPEARIALKEVQGRVMSIAMVHRSLYETSTEGRVRADELLRGIIGTLMSAGLSKDVRIKSEQHYDPITLYPDQAVPLSLMASESITNALKYIGRPEQGHLHISVTLDKLASDKARLTIQNSKGTPIIPPDQAHGTGLGRGLIGAFARQIGGTLEVVDDANVYEIIVEFPIAHFDETQTDSDYSALS